MYMLNNSLLCCVWGHSLDYLKSTLSSTWVHLLCLLLSTVAWDLLGCTGACASLLQLWRQCKGTSSLGEAAASQLQRHSLHRVSTRVRLPFGGYTIWSGLLPRHSSLGYTVLPSVRSANRRYSGQSSA